MVLWTYSWYYLMSSKINPDPKNRIPEELFIVEEEESNSTKDEIREGKFSMGYQGRSREEKYGMFT